MRTNLVLIGFMGTGKNAIGRIAARRLGFQFIDTDSLLVQRSGMEIGDIFKDHGEEHFRSLETSVLDSLDPMNRCVIATGGGIVLRPENCDHLRQLGYVVLLTADEDTIRRRVEHNARRPLLQSDENLPGNIASLLAIRRPLYEATAQFTIDNSSLTREKAAGLIVEAARKAFGWQS